MFHPADNISHQMCHEVRQWASLSSLDFTASGSHLSESISHSKLNLQIPLGFNGLQRVRVSFRLVRTENLISKTREADRSCVRAYLEKKWKNKTKRRIKRQTEFWCDYSQPRVFNVNVCDAAALSSYCLERNYEQPRMEIHVHIGFQVVIPSWRFQGVLTFISHTTAKQGHWFKNL